MRTLTRTVLLAVLALAVLFVFIERDNITECARTCECAVAGFDLDVPGCDDSLV